MVQQFQWNMVLLRLILIPLALFSNPSFSDSDIRTERVTFAKGANSTVIESSINGYDIVDYLLTARAGQTLNASLGTKHGATYFNIMAPGENPVAMFNGSIRGNQYEGTLPATGDYTLRVYMMRSAARRGEQVEFRLEVVCH